MKFDKNQCRAVLPYLLIAGAVVLRLAVNNHPFNFVPVFSCLLFFGAKRPVREWAIAFLALLGTDIFLTQIRYGYPLTSDHAVTWIWYAAAMILGSGVLRNTTQVSRAVGTSLLASVSFFLASNFAVWAQWGMYPKTWSGLGACYIAALQFFRNSLISETVFSALIFAVAKYSRTRLTVWRAEGVCS